MSAGPHIASFAVSCRTNKMTNEPAENSVAMLPDNAPKKDAPGSLGLATGSAVLEVDKWVIMYPHEDGDAEVVCADMARDLERENIKLRAEIAAIRTGVSSQTPDGEILDWLDEHAISVRIQANAHQSFVIPATREAIRFEMTSGNVDSPNNADEPRGEARPHSP